MAAWVASGYTMSTPIVSLCLSAGWTHGGMKDKYLFLENAEDQHTGRFAACLYLLTKELALSPLI